MIIAVDVVALWGLCAYGSHENVSLGHDNLPIEPRGGRGGQRPSPRAPGDRGQKEAYNGGARLTQHRRLAFPGEAPQFHLGRVVSGLGPERVRRARS
jgi:hypothetical protein